MFKAFKEKMEEITTELGKLKMDVIGLTETKRKGTGMEIVRGYVLLYSGVSKDRRAERGVPILINKKFKIGITNWEAVNENIITVNISNLGTKIIVLCVYAPSNDKVNLEKDQFYEIQNIPILKLWEVLRELTINNTLIKALQNLYSNTAQVKIGHKLTHPFNITKGLRQKNGNINATEWEFL